jgi:hypothetical protein
MWEEKKQQLRAIYDRFEQEAEVYKQKAICKLGCTYCCTDVGNVDINTLEGSIIWEWVHRLKPIERRKIKQKVALNKKQKEWGETARCPFLQENRACLIYDIRPFSCRQLYSVQECRPQGPTVHRQAVRLAQKAVRGMQQLDDTGYSGDLRFIYHLLEKNSFRKLYISGGFDPGRIMTFGKRHKIIINRYVS